MVLLRLLRREVTDFPDEDAVRFVRFQQIGIIESEGESLGRRRVSGGEEKVSGDKLGAAKRAMKEVTANPYVMICVKTLIW